MKTHEFFQLVFPVNGGHERKKFVEVVVTSKHVQRSRDAQVSNVSSYHSRLKTSG